MAAPTTGHSFLDVLRKSKLLPDDRLTDYLGRLSNSSVLTAADIAVRMVQDGLLTRFQANHLLKGRYKNFYLGKFKILEPLGSGGMSQVFLCEHAVMRHRVAMKMLPVRENADKAALTRFLREARAAAAVNHPNVVRAHDFDLADGKYYYLIMDYVDGVNLHDLVKRIGPLPPNRSANYIAQVAAGLQHIAECGLVHRDIKPSNVLLDRVGVVRILDLGLARFTEDDKDNVTRQFQGQAVIGTADYLAPEQALMADRIDTRADVYSLGGTFYYLLSGRAPFEQSSVPQKLLAHQLREPEALAGVPPEMQAVIRRMMQKRPGDRYQTPSEVIRALTPWLTEELPPPDEGWFPNRHGSGSMGSGPRTAPSTGTGGKTAPRTGIGVTGNTPAPRGASGTNSGLSAMAATAPAPFPSAARPARDPKARRKELLLATAAGGIVLAVGLMLIVFVNPFGRKNAPPATPATGSPTSPVEMGDALPPDLPPPPAGSLVVSATGPIKTVAAALAQVKPGGRIVIAAAEHSELLVVDTPPPNVTVLGWPEDRPVRWTAPAGSPPTVPLVRIGTAEGFALSNVALDGGGRVHVLAVLAGQCPGTRLEGVTASGFSQAAVQLVGCQGEPGREVRLERVDVAGSGADAGVRITTAAEGLPTRHVRVHRCRFLGPLGDAVALSGPADGVAVSFSRFFEVGSGVRLASKSADRTTLSLTNNAFVSCRSAALAADTLPPAGSRVEATNNLFVQCPKMATCGGITGTPAFDPPLWIWHDEGPSSDKTTTTPPGTRYFRKTFKLPTPPAEARLDIGAASAFKVWVNGVFVGESNPKHFTKRVYAFAVGPKLKPGLNAIAVEASLAPDTISPGSAVTGGLTVRLAAAGPVTPIAISDASWTSIGTTPGSAWQTVDFKAPGWPSVRVWDREGLRLPWQGSIWDVAVAEHLNGRPAFPMIAAGNVRDTHSNEGYPLLDSLRSTIKGLAGTNPADDHTFLRTPRALPRLYIAGTNGGPVGVPLDR